PLRGCPPPRRALQGRGDPARPERDPARFPPYQGLRLAPRRPQPRPPRALPLHARRPLEPRGRARARALPLPRPLQALARAAPGAPPEPAGTVRSDPPEELTPAERAAFVGVEWRAVRLEGDALVVSTVLSRPLAEAVEASFYLFGYRRDRSFGRMPKLRVEVG